ncbi:MAG TPA: hypothetical protein VHT49_07485 [Acidimicrobiales bacterium]|jgi:hypothetical protein|nr:hypothetical protein [Acidimicrobiales bacterium]
MVTRDAATSTGTGRQHLVAFVLLLIATGAFFFPVLFQGQSFTAVRNDETIVHPWTPALPTLGVGPVQSDQADLSYPWQVDLTNAVNEGTLPFWNPNAFMGGYPLYTNGSSAQLFPLHLLGALFLSPTAAHDALCFIEVLFAGFFTYLLLRELKIGMAGAMLAAVAWMFCTFNMAWLNFEVVSPIQFLLPLGLLLVHRAWRKSTWTAALMAGLCLGITMLAGHVLWMAITCVVVGGYAVALAAPPAWEAWHAKDRDRLRRTVAIPVVMVVSAIGVAAVELLPLAASLGNSQRHSFSYSDLSKFIPGEGSNALSTPSTLAHIFYPISQPLSVSNINTSMIFAGTLTAIFAVVGIFTRRPGSGLGKWILFGFALIAVGSSWTWLAYHFIPIFRVFWPYGRLFQWSTFGLALLAGIGLDETVKAVARRQGRIDYGRATIIGLGLAALTAAQLIPIGRSLNPPFATINASTDFPATGLIRAIESYQKQSPWPARVVPVSSTSAQLQSGLLLNPGNYDLLYNLDLVSGYDSVIPARTVTVAKYIEGQPLQSLTSDQSQAFWLLPNEASIRYSELTRFGVSAMATLPKFTSQADWGGAAREDLPQSTVYAGNDGNLIDLNGADVGPRVVTKVAFVNSANSAFQTFVAPNFPWQQEVVLESSQLKRLSTAEKTAIVEMAVGKPVTATVSSVQPGINSLSMTVHSSGPGLLVIPENWDQGWSAEVNGQSETLLQGNYVQQVLQVPAGTSTVVLRFRPPHFDLGATVTILSLLVIVSVGVGGYVRRRSVTGTPTVGE